MNETEMTAAGVFGPHGGQEKNADDWLALHREAHVLAEFAKTAPGRLPSRVQEAIAHVSGVPGTDGSKR